jgi:hypothetical protein
VIVLETGIVHKGALVLFTFAISTSLFGQTDDRNLSPAPPPTEPPASARPRKPVTNTAFGYIPKYINSSGGLAESVLLDDSGSLKIFGPIYALGATGIPRMFFDYPASPGYGADVTGTMAGVHMLSFGFNSAAQFSGTNAAASGRTLYFYDRVTNEYRAVIDGAGTWWFGSAVSNYGLRVMAPTGSVIGMTVNASGNVAIGASAPPAGKKLYVLGDVQFDGSVIGTNIRAQYQDVAEWVPSAEDLTPGTVVVVDKRKGNTVRASMTAYDTSVAGVVSGQPGIILGEEAASKEQVATTGRVRVRVDASKGAIQLGDLLVTSDIPGTAMKSVPVDLGGISIHRPGTIIGKALEPLASGVGEILVLLSLQ